MRDATTLMPCGTPAAYKRHLKLKEVPCEPCRQASRAQMRARYTPRALYVRPTSPCGTVSAYKRHLRLKEKPCEACRQATRDRDPYRYSRVCAGCEKPFLTGKSSTRVCSLACRNWISPQFNLSIPIPDTHPAHPNYWKPAPPRVSLIHAERSTCSAVRYEDCCWCDGTVVVTPYTAYWSGSLHCSKRCQRAHAKRTRKAKERGASGSYTQAELMRLHLSADKLCSYCDTMVEGLPDPDHVVPLSRGGSNSITNVVPCCHNCNSQKSDQSLDEWKARRVRLGLPPRRYDLHGPRFQHLALAPIQPRTAA